MTGPDALVEAVAATLRGLAEDPDTPIDDYHDITEVRSAYTALRRLAARRLAVVTTGPGGAHLWQATDQGATAQEALR